jgi:hypothetical protein
MILSSEMIFASSCLSLDSRIEEYKWSKKSSSVSDEFSRTGCVNAAYLALISGFGSDLGSDLGFE